MSESFTSGPEFTLDDILKAADCFRSTGPILTKLGMRVGEYDLWAQRATSSAPASFWGGVPVYPVAAMPHGVVYIAHYSNGDVELMGIDGKVFGLRAPTSMFGMLRRP